MDHSRHDWYGLEHALHRSAPLEQILMALVTYHDGPMRPTFTPFQQDCLVRARRDIAMALQSIVDGNET